MVLRLLVDTCVWFDLAMHDRERPVIAALEHLIKQDVIELIVPQTVLDEFDRNKAEKIAQIKRGFQPHVKKVLEAVHRFGSHDTKLETMLGIKEVDHKIAVVSDALDDAFDRIEKLLHSVPTRPVTNNIKQRAADRALAKQAPFHKNKNSVGDAIILETFSELVSNTTDTEIRYGFVTSNYKDFSDPTGDRRHPHRDLVDLFKPPQSSYWLSIAEVISKIAPELLSDYEYEANYSRDSRRLSEILDAEQLLMTQVWYNRHWNRYHEIEEGTLHLVSQEEFNSHSPRRHDQIVDSVWAGAMESARKVEEKLGRENLGPWDDFEWGMINGKLSTLRWVLGEDWDELYT